MRPKRCIQLAVLPILVAAGAALADSKVTVGSPAGEYVRNAQNEPSVALDPTDPPALAFGPRRGANGFDWAAGSRLYYSHLASNFPGADTFAGLRAIALSYTDDAAAAAAGDASAWSPP